MESTFSPCCGFQAASQQAVKEIGLNFCRCSRCQALSLPPNELKFDYVDADTTGPLSLVMKILFMMRMLWFKLILPELGNKSAKILDAGCGDGQFIQYLQTRGFKNICGYEIDEQRLTNAKKRPIAVYSTLDQACAGKDGFDIVFLWHVYEHLDVPIQLLTQLLAKLNEKGVLILSVPNQDSWQNKLFGLYSSFLDYGRHKWFLTADYFFRLEERLPEYRIDKVTDLNFEYEIYSWIDSLCSFLFHKQNFVHMAIKKGQGSILTRATAFILAVVLFPVAVLLSAASLAFKNAGSTVTVTFRRKN